MRLSRATGLDGAALWWVKRAFTPGNFSGPAVPGQHDWEQRIICATAEAFGSVMSSWAWDLLANGCSAVSPIEIQYFGLE